MNSIASIFSRTWRAAASLAAPSPQPIAAPLHVLDPEARLRIDDGLLAVERAGQKTIRLRLPDLLSVSLHGRAAMTTPAVQALLQEGIPIVWRAASGHYLGQTIDLIRPVGRVRRAQYAAAGTPMALDIARALVAAKVANQRALLRRRVRDSARIASAVESLAMTLDKIPHVATLEALLGHEGAASAAYFGCWPDLLKGPAAALPFPGRQRRPAIGPVNAFLSYSYAVLAGHCATAAVAAGLDPTEGFLHAVRPGRPALALDLMEPFRAAIADSTVLSGLNTGELEAADFSTTDGETLLTDTGRKKALAVLERRLDGPFTDVTGSRLPWRAAIDRAAGSLAQCLVHDDIIRLVFPRRP